jgi:multidrug efflux pump
MITTAPVLGTLLIPGGDTGSELPELLGVTAVSGLIVSRMLTLFTTPVIHLHFDRLAVRPTGGRPAAPIVPEAPAE